MNQIKTLSHVAYYFAKFLERVGQMFCLYSLYISLNGIKYRHTFVEEVFLVHVMTKYFL